MSDAISTRPTTATAPHIVTREFDAPRDLVWDACTQAHHLANWFAPGGRKGHVKTMDFRVGGMVHYCQTAPDGSDPVWGRGIYTEISPKNRIVYMQSFSDEQGNIGAHPMAPGWPRVMHCIYRFDDLGGNRTRLTVEWTPADDSSLEAIAMFDGARAGMNGGWKGTLDNLENYLNTLER
ncbi:MAG: SRPBCC domain-containing protein [Flavobacteriales bacterium]|nr:SRPBCC domain-containing protein [Flavobacteriales bacterium]